MSWFGWVFTASENNEFSQLDDVEKVELLCERISTASLIDDKKKSLTDLRLLSENSILEVGTRALNVVMDVLKNYSQDKEMTSICLDIIMNIIKEKQEGSVGSLATQFCEIFLKDKNYTDILITLIDSNVPAIRWNVLKIFIAFSNLQLNKFQYTLESIHFGVERIIDYLNDEREAIRNDCILLLTLISANDKIIQKTLAFNNLFDKLFDIITSEGIFDGGIIVSDCLNIIKNIVTNNNRTQKDFVETGHFKKIKKMFDLFINDSNATMNEMRTTFFGDLINLIKCFLDPVNSEEVVVVFQNAIQYSQLFSSILCFMTVPDLSEQLFVETITLVAEIIRGNSLNQQMFDQHNKELKKSNDTLLAVTYSILNPKYSLHIKYSMLYLFQCYIQSNKEVGDKIVFYLSPTDCKETPEMCRALLAGFFDYDNTLTWASSNCLSYIILNFPSAKSFLLKMRFAFDGANSDADSISLLERCVSLLNSSTVPSVSKINIICFLIMFMIDTPEAVIQYLEIKDVISLHVCNILRITLDDDTIYHGLNAILLSILLFFSESNESKKHVQDGFISHFSLTDLKNLVVSLTYNSNFVLCSLSPRFAYPVPIYFNYELTQLIKRIDVLLGDFIAQNCPKSVPKIDYQALIKEKDSEIERLSEEIKDIMAQNKYLMDNLLAGLTTETKQWKEKYVEQNMDFQKLLNDHKNLLELLASQESEVLTLREQLKSYEAYISWYEQYHQSYDQNPLDYSLAFQEVNSNYPIQNYVYLAPENNIEPMSCDNGPNSEYAYPESDVFHFDHLV